jgi:uncharacterized repeat protein (TIGR02543 family)
MSGQFYKNFKKVMPILLVIFVMLSLAQQVLAATVTWDSNGASAGQTNGGGAWLNPSRWWNGSTNVNWTSGDDAIFGAIGGGAAGSVTLASPTTVNSITFNSYTAEFTLGTAGQTITLNNGIIKNDGGTNASIISPITLEASQSWVNNSTSLLTIGSTMDIGSNSLSFDGSSAVGIRTTGVITGSGTVIKNGTGLARLGDSGTPPVHSYTGSTIINNGVLRQASNNIPSGNITINNGVLESFSTTAFTRSLGDGLNQIQILGGESGFSLSAAASANITLDNNASTELVWGSTYFNPSIFVLQSPYSLGGTTQNLTFQNGLDLNGSNRIIKVFEGSAGTAGAILSNVIRNSSGTAGFTKTGNGRLILSALNTYNGNTIVESGTLRLSHVSSNNISSSPVIRINSGATLNTVDLASTTDLILASGQRLEGEGTVVGNLTVANGSLISPGTSPGILTHTGNLVYASGGTYIWEINNATGTPGVNWDLQNISGTLNISATSLNKFNIDITSLNLGNTVGDTSNFDKYSNYTWTIATASGGITGFDVNKFNLSTMNFSNDISGTDSNGYFGIQVSGNDLQITYTAAVDLPTFTISYDSNTATGGSVPPSQTKTLGIDLTLASNTGLLVKTGHTFVAWNTQADGDGINYAEGANFTVDTDTTLYAKWSINQYTLTFDSDGGTAVNSITDDFGASITQPTSPTRSGYTFTGWSPALPSTMPAANTTYTAQWSINQYTLTFDSDGGTAVNSITDDFGASITQPTSPTRSGYTFTGWSPALPSTMPAANTTFTALWTQNPQEEPEPQERRKRIIGYTSPVQAKINQTQAPLPTTIEGLRSLLVQLQAQLTQLLSQKSSINKDLIERDLQLNAVGDDVRKLQELLMSKGYSIPQGVTGFFGPQTQSALIKFQQDNNITPAIGYYGPVTRAILNR